MKELQEAKKGKTKIISFRLEKELINILHEICNKYGMTQTDLIKYMIQEKILFLIKGVGSKIENKELLREFDLFQARKSLTDRNHARYTIANAIRTARNLGFQSAYLNGGEVNMKPIRALIKDTKRVFDSLPKDIKKELRSDWNELQKLKAHDSLVSMMSNLRRIEKK